MSDLDKERASGGGGGGDGDDDDDDEEIVPENDCKKQSRHRRDLRKVKQLVAFSFRKVKEQMRTRKNKDSRTSSFAASASARVSCSGKSSTGCCYMCFTQPPTLESPADSQTSDPNNPNFTYECLKALMEKNDFYSKECNPHIDIISSYSD